MPVPETGRHLLRLSLAAKFEEENVKKLLLTCIALAVFGAFVLLQPVVSGAQQGGIAFYFYDDNGRLRSMVRADGQVAIYQYDASGNLLSISRQPTPSSISSFSPATGLVNTNTQVTINGSGFGATVAENRVLFNGLQAQILSATATQIMAIVPNGATTGAITVIMPTSAAISATPFTVIQPSNDLSISGFTPIIGNSGASVTITGTNFDPTPANNRVEFNGFVAAVTAGTTTSLTATVPAAATSGRIKIIAPAGVAVSEGDFFIPPSPTTISQVEVTGRMAIGETKALNITTNGRAGLFVFDGVAGDKVSVVVNSSTLEGSLTVFNPSGTSLASTSTVIGSLSGFIDVRTLPTTGTYTIRIAAASNRRGAVTFTLHRVPPDATATGTIGGAQFAIPITVPGQNAVVTFQGTTGQRLSILVPVLSNQSAIRLLDPGLTVLESMTSCCAGSLFFLERQLATSGVYRLEIDPGRMFTGNLLCQIYEAPPDLTATITVGGPPVSVQLTVPGQKARLTFSGVAGQRVGLQVTFPGIRLHTSILAPDLSRLYPANPDSFTVGEVFTDLITLPVAGVYTIILDPVAEDTGTVSSSLITIADDISATITPNGQPVSVATTTPGQKATLTFNSTAGQRFSLFVRFTSAAADPSFTVFVRDGGGLNIGRQFLGEGFVNVFSSPSPFDSTISITLDPAGTATGTFQVNLYNVPADVSGGLTFGAPLAVPITTPGQNASLTFNGVAGQKISLKIAGTAGFVGELQLFNPPSNSGLLEGISFTGEQQEVFFEPPLLPTTGIYTLSINPSQASTGAWTVTLYNVTVVNGGVITINGPAVTLDLSASGQAGELQDGELTLTVPEAGQFITVEVTNNITGCVSIEFVTADVFSFGTTASCDGNPIHFDSQEFSGGTYKIRVNPAGTSAGSVTVRVISP